MKGKPTKDEESRHSPFHSLQAPGHKQAETSSRKIKLHAGRQQSYTKQRRQNQTEDASKDQGRVNRRQDMQVTNEFRLCKQMQMELSRHKQSKI